MSKGRTQVFQEKFDDQQRQWERAERWIKLARRDSCYAVAQFNGRIHSPIPQIIWPTFRALWYAERYYIGTFCPACKQEGCLDIGKVDWHPEATINVLIPQFKCVRCGPGAPLPTITGLWKQPRGQVLRTRRFRELPEDCKRIGRRRDVL